MTPESLGTLLGVVVAVYALLSPERRRDLLVRLGWLDWAIIAIALLLIHYILFYPILKSIGVAPYLGTWRWGFTEATASYSILLVAAVVVGVRVVTTRLGRGKMVLLRELFESQLHARKYEEALYLFNGHLNSIIRAARNDYLFPRLKEKMNPSPWSAFGTTQAPLRWYQGKIFRWLSMWLPGYEDSKDTADDILHRLLTYEPFARTLAALRPHSGLRVLASDIRQARDFQELWLSALLDDQHSVLYSEIKDNQNMSGIRRYVFPPGNRVLFFYFGEISRAKDLAVYKPIGDYFLQELRRKAADALSDRYNGPLDDFEDEAKWKDPCYAVLQMFGFMIPEAVHAGITWHMWLYYAPLFVEQIVQNLEPTPRVDLAREWPTPYHYFLYECIHSLCDWVTIVQDIEVDQENIEVKSTSLDHENGNIPKSSALALGQALRYILHSPKITPRFKAYLLGVSLRVLNDLDGNARHNSLRRVVISSIANGGFATGNARLAHQHAIRNALDDIDVVAKLEHEDQLVAAFA
jgi:hypothetical protein